MNTTEIRPAKSDSEIQDIAILAEEIWHQHFTPIIGKEQVDYMVDKFQSYPAIKAQIEHDGYEYFQIYRSHAMAGYTGIHQEADALFLSKLYVKKEFRGCHLATEAFQFLVNLCRERGLSKIYLPVISTMTIPWPSMIIWDLRLRMSRWRTSEMGLSWMIIY